MAKTGKGFTLIEVLIALVVFSIVMGLAAYSFRFHINIINKIIFPYPKEAMEFSKLGSAIRSGFYYIGEKKGLMGKGRFFIFFKGQSDEMEFITAKPIMGGKLAVCRLFFNDGNLICEESPVYSKDNNYKYPEITAKSKKVVLISGIEDFFFEYFKNGEKMSSDVSDEMPDAVVMRFKEHGQEKTYFFKIESDFSKKKELTGYYYAPF